MDETQVDIYQNGEDIDDSMFDDPEDFVDDIPDEGTNLNHVLYYMIYAYAPINVKPHYPHPGIGGDLYNL